MTKPLLHLNTAFLVSGRAPVEFELIREACIANLFAQGEDVREDLSRYIGSKRIIYPDYHITQGFIGDYQLFVILKSPSLGRSIVAYLGDIDPKYRHLEPSFFKTI